MIEVLFIPLAGRHSHTYHAILCGTMLPNAAAIAENGFVRIMAIPNAHRYPVLVEMACHMKLMMCNNVNNKTRAYCYIPMVRKCKWYFRPVGSAILEMYLKTIVGHGSLFYTAGPRISSVTGGLQVQTANNVEVWCLRFCYPGRFLNKLSSGQWNETPQHFNDFTVVFFLQL